VWAPLGAAEAVGLHPSYRRGARFGCSRLRETIRRSKNCARGHKPDSPKLQLRSSRDVDGSEAGFERVTSAAGWSGPELRLREPIVGLPERSMQSAKDKGLAWAVFGNVP
jgi:hypothetical protein